MKRSAVLTFLVFGFFFAGSAFLSPTTAQRSLGPSKSASGDSQIAETVRLLTNRSTAGLPRRRDKRGGETTDLLGRFQNVALLRSDSDGDPMVGCINSIEEANDFFGRDLETGEVYTFNAWEAEYLATKRASRTDISREEFTFYKGLIETHSNLISSPNSASFIIDNQDGEDEGFNDPTPMSPEGGNPGMTLGQLRLNLFNHAASI